MTFGERLRNIRIAKGITQTELSQKAGISQYLLSWYENDRVQPTLSRIEWLCICLKVTATELLGF
ncbi:MAG: helix-turn-helix transcriptional regulator [Alphaproteobacteria bacterium]|nr:helix-turn-helix transcriptional regulator [Alphaproteobacteria bacterium]